MLKLILSSRTFSLGVFSVFAGLIILTKNVINRYIINCLEWKTILNKLCPSKNTFGIQEYTYIIFLDNDDNQIKWDLFLIDGNCILENLI